MTAFTHSIVGGDFERAGAASAALKNLLKSVGVDAHSTRRAVVAAYEAELNVVIHAERGVLSAAIYDRCLDVEVTDEGPGIADLAQALRPGFSTASALARSLGFGAGLGLPNIQRNADAFSLDSTVGVGSRLRFSVRFCAERPLPAAPNSLRVSSELCSACLRCVSACPTHALRVRGDGPVLLPHRCIDCNECIAVCAQKAIATDVTDQPVDSCDIDVLVVPAAVLADFGLAAAPALVVASLLEAGVRRVAPLEDWEQAQQEALAPLAASSSLMRPLLVGGCPAVVNLVETRFPSLLPHLPPLVSSVEAAAKQLADVHAAFVVTCPAQATVLRSAGVAANRILLPRLVRRWLAPRLAPRRPSSPIPPAAGSTVPRQSGHDTLHVTGTTAVMRVLEALETGRIEDLDVIALQACCEGCFGSPLLRTGGPVARYRWGRAAASCTDTPPPVYRDKPFTPRSALRLDPDMHASVRLLHRMADALRGLPGADCARCGAPSCRAHAEDWALGRVRVLHCRHPRFGRTA